LPERELRCGLAEVIKYGAIFDAAFFGFLEQNADAILAREPGVLRYVVAESCRMKASVVSRDEREEAGLRAVLNFGHTIGHAVESVTGYGARFQHGEAVAVGMVAECCLAERIGWINTDLTTRVTALVQRFGLPTRAPGLDSVALIDAMGRDKKNLKGKTRFVLPRELGRVELTDAPGEADVREVVSSVVAARK
jgi:3-dehydroquinate synthase